MSKLLTLTWVQCACHIWLHIQDWTYSNDITSNHVFISLYYILDSCYIKYDIRKRYDATSKTRHIIHNITHTHKNPFIDVFYHQSSERHPGHTARAPPFTRGGRVRTGDQTTTSPTPWPLGHDTHIYSIICARSMNQYICMILKISITIISCMPSISSSKKKSLHHHFQGLLPIVTTMKSLIT